MYERIQRTLDLGPDQSGSIDELVKKKFKDTEALIKEISTRVSEQNQNVKLKVFNEIPLINTKNTSSRSVQGSEKLVTSSAEFHPTRTKNGSKKPKSNAASNSS